MGHEERPPVIKPYPAGRGPVPPSGDQIELEWGDQKAVVTEVGAGLRSYARGAQSVLDGYEVGDMCTGGRGQVLMPWPNRIAHGRFRFEGTEHQLPLTEPERGHAIHGLVRWVTWRVVEQERQRAVLECLLRPQPGYPFTLEVAIEYQLSDAGLAVHTSVTNRSESDLPFGAGFHPYITVGTERIDEATLTVPAASWLETDDRGIPTGTKMPVDGSSYDFRAPRPIGTAVLDICLIDLERDENGLAHVTLQGPDRYATTVWMDDAFPYVMVFTGDTLAAARARRGLAVEPMTCAPDAFRSGDGRWILAPGETKRSAWGIASSSR